MPLVMIACVSLIALGEPGTPAWFGKRAGEAEELAKKSDEAGALKLMQELADHAAKLRPEDSKEEMELFVQWKKGVCEFWLGDLTQSIKTLEQIEDKEKNQFFRHYLLIDLADAMLDTGRVKQAEPLLQKGLDLAAAAEKKGAKRAFEEAEFVRIKLLQVRCKVALGEMDEAKKRLGMLEDTVFEKTKKIEGAKREHVAELQGDWQMLRAEADLFDRNVVTAVKRLETAQKDLEAFPDSHKATFLRFHCLLRLARDYWLVARYPEAARQLEAAEALVAAKMLHRIELGYADIKNARAALALEEVHFAIEDQPAENHLSMLDQAERHLNAALTHRDKIDRGQAMFTVAIAFHRAQVHELRGRVLTAAGKKAEAKAELESGQQQCTSALEQLQTALKLPDYHDRILEVRNRRAWINLRLGDAKSAQEESSAALAAFDSKHKPGDLDRGRYLHLLLEAEDRLGNTEAAIRYASEHRKLVDDGLNTILAGLSSTEQIQFFRKWDAPGLHASLRLGLRHAKNQDALAASVEWLVNGKSKLAEVLAAQTNAVKQKDKETLARFQKSVQRQAYLLYGLPTKDAKHLQRDFLFEEASKREIANAAAKEVTVKPHWYTLQEIRDNLGDKDVYVGIYNLGAETSAQRQYHAWVVTKKDAIQTVSLGDADKIDTLVKAFLREQERFSLITPGEEKKAEADLRLKCLEPLSKLVMQPIRKIADDKTRLIVSPDGALWNLPFAALLTPGSGRYAAEDLTFRYAVSGSDLVSNPMKDVNLGEPLVLGDPRFNFKPNDKGGLRKAGDPLKIPWDRLQHSERECATVLSIMNALQMRPNQHVGTMRKEQLFEMPRPPRMVYLSTHAYAPLPSKVPVNDPFLSCALAFGGWNYLPEGTASDASLGGMMTGSELLAVDLRGTELVVLASCQSGFDNVSAGQSPANLRHAFHLAGAQAVVSALWSINDKSTMGMMEPFMETVCREGVNRVDALRDAQQQSIRYLRMYRDHSHPFYWAGYTISGR